MEFVGSVKSDSFLLGPGMLINYLQANENDLLNLTAFSPKFSSSPSGKGERNAIVKTWLKVRDRAGQDGMSPSALMVSLDSLYQQVGRDLEGGMGGLCSPLCPLRVLVIGQCL